MNIRNYILLLLFVIPVAVFAQKDKLPPPPPLKHSDKNPNYKPIPLSERLQKYPFAKATKVRLVSFNLDYDPEELVITPVGAPDPEPQPKPVSLPNVLHQKDLPGLSEGKMLDRSQIDRLTDVLYNSCGKSVIGSYSVRGCYNPRNAVLFYYESDTVFQYIEICFECAAVVTKPVELKEMKEYCSEVYPALEQLFNQLGVETKKHPKH